MLRQGWAEAKSKLGKLMYKGRYSSACIGENPPRGGGMSIMRDQCMDTKQSIMLRGIQRQEDPPGVQDPRGLP